MAELRPLKLLSRRDEAAGAKTFRWAVPAGFDFTPGMWLMFYFLDDLKEGRAYSLCSSPLETGYAEVTVAPWGEFTQRLFALKPGDEMQVRGPLGKWIFDEKAPKSVLVSEGTGVAPFRSMCRFAAAKGLGSRLSLLCSAATEEALLYREEHEEWRKAGIKITAKAGEHVTPQEALAAGGDEAVYYLCGANKMVQALQQGLAGRQVRQEKWGDYDLKF
jgi:ferredoxin-NADP reductase